MESHQEENITEIENIPVSELCDLMEVPHGMLCSDSLFLVSQKSNITQKYISEKLKYNDFVKSLSSSMNLEDMKTLSNNIDELKDRTSDLLISDIISVDCSSPYILCSFSTYKGRLHDPSAYRLSRGMDMEFKNTVFDQISVLSIFMGYGNYVATEDFVNSSIENAAASYITIMKDGKLVPFSTYAELSSTQVGEMYKGGKPISENNPLDVNDYCYVLSDETAEGSAYGTEDPKTTRYRYTYLSSHGYDTSGWVYMYNVNNSPFTDKQWKNINRDIDSTHIVLSKSEYDQMLIDGSIKDNIFYCISDDV